MNRPKRNEHNRERILQTGMELFNRKGYHGTGLKEILDTCQVPKGSFYNYFESKEQFAVEVLEYSHQLEDAKWEKRTNAIEGNLLERFRLAIDQFIADYENDPDSTGCLLTNLMGEVGNASNSFREIISLSCNRVIDCIEESFKEGQLQGCFRNDLSARALAQLFWDSWQGALLRTKVEASTTPLREVADVIYTLYAPLDNPETKDGDNNEI
ncbi:TetR/AcrR family transcriptional regulator [Amphritea pacifica]|uniref:TetR/AcrR family transcriptional regulator n=1 Tax=Amphritea pacifica TaxID=2811233 RepID=A0ABS2WB01_9GAMM|nr:TetR/AcrR family transcriptional regulator [Amphritea pacifica]MBN0988522.1 TetR/AcrR family transcriptional regulator [Amphritea pacifica]MBN1008395.1 TetR/AcrR family transcriptional regulator [Amphritea pacifica]